jgi:hypothetical protein
VDELSKESLALPVGAFGFYNFLKEKKSKQWNFVSEDSIIQGLEKELFLTMYAHICMVEQNYFCQE